MIIRIRGYASVFDTLTRDPVSDNDDRHGIIAPGAFSDQLEWDLPVVLQWASHDAGAPKLANTDNGSLMLFQDSHGLGFQATIDPKQHPIIWNILSAMPNGYGCSIDTVGDWEVREAKFNGRSVWKTTQRTFSHICLTDSPNNPAAHCWRAGVPLSRTNYRILNASEKWEQGHAEYIRAKNTKPLPVLARKPKPGSTGRSVVIGALDLPAGAQMAYLAAWRRLEGK